MLKQANKQLQVEMVERKQAEVESDRLIEQLETNLGQLEAIVTSMTEGLIVSAPAGNVISMNTWWAVE